MGEPIFWTEKQIEEWLLFETRDIPMPDGTMKPHSMFRREWEVYDFLATCASWSRADLVAEALDYSREYGLHFEDAFVDVLIGREWNFISGNDTSGDKTLADRKKIWFWGEPRSNN